MNIAEEITLNRKIEEFNARITNNINEKMINENTLKERIKLNEEREKLKCLLISLFPNISLNKLDKLLINFIQKKSKTL